MLVADEPDEAISLFESWAVATGRAPFMLRPEHVRTATVMREFTEALCRGRDLVRDTAVFLAHHLGESAEAMESMLRNSGERERERLILRACRHPDLELAANVAIRLVTDVLLDRRPRLDDVGVLSGLLVLLRPDTRAALLLSTDDLVGAAAVLERVATVSPDLPLALVATPATWAAFLREPHGRASAWLRQGWLRLGAPEVMPRDASAVPDPTPDPAPDPVPDPGEVDSDVPMRAEGLANVLLAPEVRALRAIQIEEQQGRSEAERLLYAALEAHPRLRGRFALNGKLAVPFGRHSFAEIDLLSHELRLAIEVDGAFWHLRPDNYRSDRRKDAVLQRAGFFVFRVLAEDVAPHLPEILRDIEDLADHQRRRDVDSP